MILRAEITVLFINGGDIAGRIIIGGGKREVPLPAGTQKEEQQQCRNQSVLLHIRYHPASFQWLGPLPSEQLPGRSLHPNMAVADNLRFAVEQLARKQAVCRLRQFSFEIHVKLPPTSCTPHFFYRFLLPLLHRSP